MNLYESALVTVTFRVVVCILSQNVQSLFCTVAKFTSLLEIRLYCVMIHNDNYGHY
jgi:hypothetical protein